MSLRSGSSPAFPPISGIGSISAQASTSVSLPTSPPATLPERLSLPAPEHPPPLTDGPAASPLESRSKPKTSAVLPEQVPPPPRPPMPPRRQPSPRPIKRERPSRNPGVHRAHHTTNNTANARALL